MLKKIGTILLVGILIIAVALPLQNVYAIDSFFEIREKEVSKQDNIEMIINLNKVEYEKFKFELVSDTQLLNINTKENISLNKEDNEVYIEIDRKVNNLNKISLTYQVPEDKKVGDTIMFVASITNLNDENETKTEKVQVSIVESKKEQNNTENKEDKEQKEQEDKNEQDKNDEEDLNEQDGNNQDKNNEKDLNEQDKNNEKDSNKQDENSKKAEQNQTEENKNQEKNPTQNNKQESNFAEQDKNQKQNESSKDTQNMNSSEKIESSKVIKSNETSQSVETKNLNSKQETTETIKYNGSNNNYLSNLYIEGYDLNKEFCKDNNTYFVNVATGITTVNVIAEKEDETSKICIHGNENLKTGTNKIIVNITAENGNVRTYRIYAIIN